MQKRNINDEFRILVQKKFDLIMEAAITGDASTLQKIRNSALTVAHPGIPRALTPFSIVIERHTPLSLLAFQGKHEACNLLIAQGAWFIEACIGYAVSGDMEKCDALLSEYQPDKHELFLFYEKSAWFSVNEDNRESVLEEGDYIIRPGDPQERLLEIYARVMGIASALARQGEKENTIGDRVNKAIGLNLYSRLVKEEVICSIFHAFGCCTTDAKNVKKLVVQYSAFYKQIFRGLAHGGNLILINDLMPDLNFFRRKICAIAVMDQWSGMGYLNHPELVGFLAQAMNSIGFVEIAGNVFRENKVPAAVFNAAVDPIASLNARYREQRLNHFQLEALRIPGTAIWILQGMQMVKRGTISADIFMHILRCLTGLSEAETRDLNQQLYFRYRQDFLTSDIEKYVDGLTNLASTFFDEIAFFFKPDFKKARPHYDRADSFLNAVRKCRSHEEIESLLTRQYCLFKQKPVIKQRYQSLHDEPFVDYQEDDYTRAIVSNYVRMTGS